MSADLDVLVLAGGLSYERDVSLRSGRRVFDALRGAGIDATLRDADATLLPYLRAEPPSAVVIALHGAIGEDGSLRGVLGPFAKPIKPSGAGEVTLKIREKLLDIQYGRAEDRYGWMRRLA